MIREREISKEEMNLPPESEGEVQGNLEKNEVLGEDKEIKDVAETSGRRRVEIDKSKSTRQIQEEYNVSRATAYRAQKRGYFWVEFHQRVIESDKEWNKNNSDLIKESAEKGVLSTLKGFARKTGHFTVYSVPLV